MLPLLAAAAVVSMGIGFVESWSQKKEQGESDVPEHKFKWAFTLLITNSIALFVVVLWLLIVTNKIEKWEEDMTTENLEQRRDEMDEAYDELLREEREWRRDFRQAREPENV